MSDPRNAGNQGEAIDAAALLRSRVAAMRENAMREVDDWENSHFAIGRKCLFWQSGCGRFGSAEFPQFIAHLKKMYGVGKVPDDLMYMLRGRCWQ